MRQITVDVYDFKELSKEVKEKIIEKNRYVHVEDDDWFYGDWLLDSRIFYWADNVYFNIGSNPYIQFPSLEITDMTEFCKLIGVSAELGKKIDFYFISDRDYTTTLEYHDMTENGLSEDERAILDEAEVKFRKVMNEALNDLRSEYNQRISDEYIAEWLTYDDREYFADGHIFKNN